MSFQANLSDALATAPLTRERRPAVAEQAVSPERRDNAWQREMERAQAGAWFPGALPEGEGLFRNRPDMLPAHPAPPPVSRPAAPHAVHATPVSKTDGAPHRADEHDDRIETRADGAALRQQERALNGSPAQASSQPVVQAPEDVPSPAHEGSDLAGAAAAASVGASTEGPSSREAVVEPATPNVAAAPAASPVAWGEPGQQGGPATLGALPSPSAAVQAAGPAPGAAASMHAADLGAIQSESPAATPAPSAGQAPRAAAALPAASAGAFAAALPAAGNGTAAMAEEGAGTSAAAPGVRSLASIERVLAATLGGSPGPRLHLSWDGQAVAVWLGVDGAVDPTALLRTVQNVLRQQGLQLSSLICNGRTIVLPRPAPGQQSNSEHQEN